MTAHELARYFKIPHNTMRHRLERDNAPLPVGRKKVQGGETSTWNLAEVKQFMDEIKRLKDACELQPGECSLAGAAEILGVLQRYAKYLHRTDPYFPHTVREVPRMAGNGKQPFLVFSIFDMEAYADLRRDKQKYDWRKKQQDVKRNKIAKPSALAFMQATVKRTIKPSTTPAKTVRVRVEGDNGKLYE